MVEAGLGKRPLRGEVNGRFARLRAVSEAVLAVSSELDLDRTLQKVVDNARELVGCRYAALGEARPDLKGMSRFVASGVSAEQVRAIDHWPRGVGLLGVLLRDQRPLRVRRIAEDPRSIGFPPGHPAMTSFLGVPIRLGDRILGNFYLTDKLGAAEFSQEDEDVLMLFALHAAVALENARRFGETNVRLNRSLLEIQRAERRSRFLAELSAMLPVGPIVEQLPWESVADRATELLGDGCAIYLVDPNDLSTTQARVVRHRDPIRALADERFMEDSWGLVRHQVIERRQSIFVADLEGAAATPGDVLDLSLMGEAKLSAVIMVPIQTKRRVYGVFVSVASQPATFSEDDLTFAALIADRLGIALENAELIGHLKAALQARDEFVSVATHELRTPTTILRGYVQALLAKGETGGDMERRALAAINKQTGRLADLVDELLDVSRLRGGRLELSPERLDLVALCREVVERYALLVGSEGGSRLRLQAPEEPLWGHWDRSRVDQVLTNLLSNALKYSPEGGDVVAAVRRAGGEAMVSVTDHGIGIPEDQQARLFEPFRRGSNARMLRIEGAGLGLHICKEIVERHGGRMWFESKEGTGSVFHFTLPIQEDQVIREAA